MNTEGKRKRLTRKEREIVHAKTGGRCAYCGCELPLEKMQVDHVNPIRKGGADALNNMLPACYMCNHYKSTYTVDQFREALSSIPERMERDFAFRMAEKYGLVEKKEKKIVFLFEY